MEVSGWILEAAHGIPVQLTGSASVVVDGSSVYGCLTEGVLWAFCSFVCIEARGSYVEVRCCISAVIVFTSQCGTSVAVVSSLRGSLFSAFVGQSRMYCQGCSVLEEGFSVGCKGSPSH